jgi:hypothetical protein
VTVQAPAAWFETAYRGVTPSTVYPLIYLSTQPFSGVCASGSVHEECTDPSFPPAWTTPSDGVLVLWRQDEYPANHGPLTQLSGPDLTIDGRRAKIQSWTKSAPDCPAGAKSEMAGFVAKDSSAESGLGFDTIACFGAGATPQDRVRVRTMIESLHIGG